MGRRERERRSWAIREVGRVGVGVVVVVVGVARDLDGHGSLDVVPDAWGEDGRSSTEGRWS
jgi:hypothetical protein